MTYIDLQSSLQALHLDIFGAFHPKPEDDAPTGTKTLLLLGPHEPGFWGHFTASHEYQDGFPDPLDRWSKRIVNHWAAQMGAQAVFPSDGPPYAPFTNWATTSGRAWISPVGLLVHDLAGLFVSYRAAVFLPEKIALPPLPQTPCNDCQHSPCLSSCPVDALKPDSYDIAACKAHLTTKKGEICMKTGCLVRQACPAGHGYGRLAKQSAFHMAAFNPS